MREGKRMRGEKGRRSRVWGGVGREGEKEGKFLRTREGGGGGGGDYLWVFDGYFHSFLHALLYLLLPTNICPQNLIRE